MNVDQAPCQHPPPVALVPFRRPDPERMGNVRTYPQVLNLYGRRGEVSEDDGAMKIATTPQTPAMRHLRSILRTLSRHDEGMVGEYALMAYGIVSAVTPPYPPALELQSTPSLPEAQTALDAALAQATTPSELLRVADAGELLSAAVDDTHGR